jgi:hypothetical protein
MNLYAIRIEKNETIIITAATPEEALERAGLPACLLLALEQPTEGDSRSLAKRYEIVELNHLHLHLHCNANGDLDLYDADQLTYEVLSKLHGRARLAAMRD